MTTQSAYDQKISTASELVNKHNERLQNDDHKLKWEEILANLHAAGGTTDEALQAVTWEDLEDCGLPKILARQIANTIFRKKEEKQSKPKSLTVNRVSGMDFDELLQNYDPDGERNSAVTDRLRNESGGCKFIVFNDDGSVNVEVSVKLLRELKKGLGEVPHHNIGGVLQKTYCVGERPREYNDENPLLPGRVLRDECCQNTNRSWEGVPLKARQIIYLACTRSGELTVRDNENIHNVLDVVTADLEAAVEKVTSRYPKAALMYKELDELSNLPALKLKPGQANGRRNDPFSS